MENKSSSGRFSKPAFWHWDLRAGSIQLSELYLSYFNLPSTQQNLSLQEWAGMFDPKDRERLITRLQNFQDAREQTTLSLNLRCRLSDGNMYSALCSGDVIERSEDKTPLIICGHLQIKEAVSSYNSEFSDSYLLKLLMDRLPYSIYFKDRESRFIRISRECASKFGISTAQKAIGKTDFDFFDSHHASLAFKDEQEILKTGNPVIGKIEREKIPGIHNQVQWASTTKLPIYDDKQNIIGTFGITNDVTQQIEAENALKENEQKYRSIFENIQDVYYRTTRDGTVTEISPSIERYSGYTREEVIGSPVGRFYYDQADREKLLEKLKEKGIVTDFEVRFENADNRYIYTSVSANVLRDENGEVIGVDGIMRDITERKRAELKLEKTHSFYNQILSNTSEGIYVVDREMRYIYWNSMMEKISGFREKDVLGKTPEKLFHHVRDNNIIKSIQQALNGETNRSPDYHYHIKETGKSGWVQAFYTPLWNGEGEIESALVAISDITDRKAAEKKLRESDETLTKLSEQVPGAIYQFQQFPGGTSCFPFASKAFFYVYELYPEEVKNQSANVLQRIDIADRARVINSINNSFQTLKYWEEDYRVNLPERGLRWLRGRARPEKQADGSVIWHGYISDITDKKQNEHELNRTLDIVSDQNSRLTNFAHIVSHNLRNHAGNISSLLSLYEAENTEEEKEQLLNYLNMASRRLNEAIQDLNEIIDQQSGAERAAARINIHDYIHKIKEILSTDIIVNNVTFETTVPKDVEIEYNPAYLESILLNLISNAIKYRHPDRAPVVRIDLSFSRKTPLLTIRDNGLGIDLEKHQAKLFGMYNTFHGNENSKGIGLYITKNQVESLGGSIVVESEIDKGTTFTIDLTCNLMSKREAAS